MKWTMTTIPITKASFRKPYSSRWRECKPWTRGVKVRVSNQGSMYEWEGNKSSEHPPVSATKPMGIVDRMHPATGMKLEKRETKVILMSF